MFSGWVNRHQNNVIDYLMEDNRALRSSSVADGFASTTISEEASQ